MKKPKKKKPKSKIAGNNIKEFLLKREMTQAQLAKKCGTNTSHISNLINNKVGSVSLAIAAKISKALNAKIEEIFILE